jgi:hypothetical protein
MSGDTTAPAKSPAGSLAPETQASRPNGPKTGNDRKPHIGPKPHIGKAILAFLIADLLLWATELVPALALPLILGAELPKFDMVMLLTPLIIIPWLTGAPALLGLGLHALIGRRLSRPLLLLALLALCIWWGITNGQTFLAPDYVTANLPPDGSGIPGLVPFDPFMLGLLVAPGAVWALVYVGLLGRSKVQ